MADLPPPYPGNEKGSYPPQPQTCYPPEPQSYQQPPPQAAYPEGAYPPPGGAYPQPGQQGQPGLTGKETPLVVNQPAVSVVFACREAPVRTICPHCRADVVTAIEYDGGTFSWMLCALLCFFGCYLCCFIPFCVDGCQDVIHTCPNCHQQIGRWNRM